MTNLLGPGLGGLLGNAVVGVGQSLTGLVAGLSTGSEFGLSLPPLMCTCPACLAARVALIKEMLMARLNEATPPTILPPALSGTITTGDPAAPLVAALLGQSQMYQTPLPNQPSNGTPATPTPALPAELAAILAAGSPTSPDPALLSGGGGQQALDDFFANLD